MTTEGSAAEIVDARGLRCPLPVLKAEKRLAQLPGGAVLIVLASDPIAKIDLPLYCLKSGYRCVTSSDGEALRFEITKS